MHLKKTRLSIEGPIDCPLTGKELLNDPALNKGTAFSHKEREEFGIAGLLPVHCNTLEDQAERAYQQYLKCPTDLSKNLFCQSMKDQNQCLYYRMLLTHITEMFSIIYTPTQGEAIEKYSQLFRRPEGCFLDICKPSKEEICARLSAFGSDEDIDYIVVSDGESILGIGDQGTGGIGISIAKLALMTLCAGIHPSRVIPIVLDTGTDRQTLLDDPLYLGNKFNRVRGEKYDEFIDNFVNSVKTLFPNAVLHFEDFGVKNAHRILDKYREQLACFNDDIQGTGAVTLSAITAALKSLKEEITACRILIFGAGSAGMGIAEQITDHLLTKGLTLEEAAKNIWLVDRDGLLSEKSKVFSPAQKVYLVSEEDAEGFDNNSLKEIIGKFKPHVLIGCSTKAGAFTEECIREMNKHVERPIIFPLSNPTRLHEAVPSDVLAWTDGQALIATGSPFPPVAGRIISENNNCFTFPGIGLGAVLSRATHITKNMLAACVESLSSQSPILTDPQGGLLPDIRNIRDISAHVATSVISQAVKDGVARVENEKMPETDINVVIPKSYNERLAWVKSQMWTPSYRPLNKVDLAEED